MKVKMFLSPVKSIRLWILIRDYRVLMSSDEGRYISIVRVVEVYSGLRKEGDRERAIHILMEKWRRRRKVTAFGLLRSIAKLREDLG
jgi:hypothetical protein